MKISVCEDGQEFPLITSWLSFQQSNELTSCWTYVTACCRP